MKKGAVLKSLGEKSCEIKGGGQQMAVIMLMLINFNNGCALLKFISINIIAANFWPPPLISQFFFSPRLFKAAALFFHSLAVFVWIIYPKNVYIPQLHSLALLQLFLAQICA